jgi:hypothetical protein
MAEKLGHFRVVEREAQLLRLERRGEWPSVIAVLAAIALAVMWFVKPWQSIGGLVIWFLVLALCLPGIMAVLCLRPWKEVLIIERPAGHLLRKEQYAFHRDKVLKLSTESVAELRAVQRILRVVDKKGEIVEHPYWAALLRSTSGEEIELDGANDQKRIRELVQAINQFLGGGGAPTS